MFQNQIKQCILALLALMLPVVYLSASTLHITCCDDLFPERVVLTGDMYASHRGTYSIAEIQSRRAMGRNFYREVRVYCMLKGCVTITIPVSDEELDYAIE
jgi:hypothetical protein